MKKIIDGFNPINGMHCVTTAMKHVFDYHKFPISESMLFGLASGLNFGYFEIKGNHVIAGRTKVGEFEKALSENIHITVDINTTTSEARSLKTLKELIKNDIPVIIYVDMYYLEYLNKNTHFGGHAIVVFGFDEEEDVFYISDRDSDHKKIALDDNAVNKNYHTISTDRLMKARNSKYPPFPAKNKWVLFEFGNFSKTAIDADMLKNAIKKTIHTLRHSPIKNIGLKGIELFAGKVLKWSNMDTQQLSEASLNCYVMINQIGGTGGGAFRKLYGDFLLESAEILNNPQLKKTGENYIELSKEWDRVGDAFYLLSNDKNTTMLKEISDDLIKIYNKETMLIDQLEQAIRCVG